MKGLFDDNGPVDVAFLKDLERRLTDWCEDRDTSPPIEFICDVGYAVTQALKQAGHPTLGFFGDHKPSWER